MWVQSLGREDPLEEEMAPHSSVLAWRIPWTEEPSELQSVDLQRVGNDQATESSRAEQYMLSCSASHFLLQGIFLTPGSHPSLWHLPRRKADSLPLVPPGKPRTIRI